MLPPSEAVRIEEMINYFPYDYLAPDISEAPFSTSLSVFQTPWNTNTKILHIGIQGAKPEIDNRPPLKFGFSDRYVWINASAKQTATVKAIIQFNAKFPAPSR